MCSVMKCLSGSKLVKRVANEAFYSTPSFFIISVPVAVIISVPVAQWYSIELAAQKVVGSIPREHIY